MSPLVVVPSNVVVGVVLVDIIVEPLSKSGRVVIGAFRVACGIFPRTVVPTIFDVVVNIVLVDIVVEPRSKSSNIVVAK